MYAAILSESIGGVSESMGGFLKAQGSGARLFSLLDKDPSATNSSLDATATQPIRLSPNYETTIQFTDVQFAFPFHPTVTVLNEVTFRLTKGEFLGLTGTSGSGKSSILSLLMRFYNPSRGTISLDGFDIKDLVRYLSVDLSHLFFSAYTDIITYYNTIGS
jgi:ABC-type multidrug transport system fused ATPase/permease subunit